MRELAVKGGSGLGGVVRGAKTFMPTAVGNMERATRSAPVFGGAPPVGGVRLVRDRSVQRRSASKGGEGPIDGVWGLKLDK